MFCNLHKCKQSTPKATCYSYDRGRTAKSERENKEKKDQGRLFVHTDTHACTETAVRAQPFVRAYFPFRFLLVTLRFRPLLHARMHVNHLHRCLDARSGKLRHRRHFRVSILFLPLPPLLARAVRGSIYVRTHCACSRLSAPCAAQFLGHAMRAEFQGHFR